MDTKASKETYTVKEIADILEISTKSAYALLGEHFFSFVRVGRIIRISKRSFDDWLNSDASL
ncbi:MAG: helix-turn-helix domain-containing protein [Enterococcus sp.]